MANRVWLTDGVTTHPSFNSGIFFHIPVLVDNNEYYITINEEAAELPRIPGGIDVWISRITSEEYIRGEFPRREAGIYKHLSAKAEVGLYQPDRPGSHCRQYQIKITSENLKDLRELRLQILSGAIRPTRSFDESQEGLSAEEAREKLSKIRGVIKALRNSRWPRCSKGRVVSELNAILGKEE